MFYDRPRTCLLHYRNARQLQRCKSSYDSGLLRQRQHAKALYNDYLTKETLDVQMTHANIQFLAKTEKSALRCEINRRVGVVLKHREALLKNRRAKLSQLLTDEKEELEREVLIYKRHQQDVKLKEMQRRKDDLAKMREDETKKIVEEKRIQQSMVRCPELRLHLFQQNLLDSKRVQLQQIKENQEHKKNAQELQNMWDNIVIRDVQQKLICDRSSAVEKLRKRQEQKADLDVQIRDKELLKLDAQRTKLENKIEMEKFDSILGQKEIERRAEELKKKERYVAELAQQIKMREELFAASTKAEQKANEEFASASKLAREQENIKAKKVADSTKTEAAQYVHSLNELLKERHEEEMKLEKLLDVHREKIALEEQEAATKIQEAVSKLYEGVLQGRRAQIEHRKQVALEQMRQRQAENELMKLAVQEHNRLKQKNARLHAEATRKYRNDLQKQIEHNRLLKEEERQKSLKVLEVERHEEEKLRKLALDVVSQKCLRTTGHPFRKVLTQDEERYPSVNSIF